jgi:hypothetical protein
MNSFLWRLYGHLGSWHANDTALDAIELVKELLCHLNIPLPEYLEKYGVEPLLREAQTCDDSESRMGILGVVESLLDTLDKDSLGFEENSLIKYDHLILDAIAFDLQPERLKKWKEPKEREQALLLLRQRISFGLTDVQKDLVERSNQGLFARLLNHLPKGI